MKPGRTLLKARCRAKRHVIARLYVNAEGRRILSIPRPGVLIPGVNGRQVEHDFRTGSEQQKDVDELLTSGLASDGTMVGCACSVGHVIIATNLLDLVTAGVTTIVLDPVR